MRDPPKDAARVALEALRRQLASDLGVDLRWGDDAELEVRKLPLGIATLDRALDGGFAFGRITEIIGEASAGKSVLCQLAMRAALARGLPCVYVDVERSYDPLWAAAVGVNPQDILVGEPRTGEQAIDLVRGLIRSDPPGVVVVDSLAALTANVETEASMDQGFVGLQARLINRGLRSIVTENRGWAVLVVNQLRESVGVTYGNPETLPGGRGQRFYAWQIVRVRRGAWIEEGAGKGRTNRVGYRLRIQLEKNKQGVPFQEAEVPFYFTGTVDETAGTVDLAIELGLLGGKAGYYEFEGTRVHGKRALTELFKADPALLERLGAAVAAVETVDV